MINPVIGAKATQRKYRNAVFCLLLFSMKGAQAHNISTIYTTNIKPTTIKNHKFYQFILCTIRKKCHWSKYLCFCFLLNCKTKKSICLVQLGKNDDNETAIEKAAKYMYREKKKYNLYTTIQKPAIEHTQKYKKVAPQKEKDTKDEKKQKIKVANCAKL